MRKENNQSKKEYVCPECEGKQDCILQVSDVIEIARISIETGEVIKTKRSGSELREWLCPECKEELSDEFVRELGISEKLNA